MYYHVLAVFGDTDRNRVLFSDLDNQQLNQQFVGAYNSGRPIIAGIYSLNPKSLRSVQVIETEGLSTPPDSTPSYTDVDWNQISGASTRTTRPSTVIEQAAWILSNGKDVTSKFIERRLTVIQEIWLVIAQLILFGAVNSFLGWLFFDDLARLANRVLGIE